MPSLEGSRDTVWPELCRAMHGWLIENEAQRALIVDTDRPSWVSHEAFYGYWPWMVGIGRTMSSSLLGTREVDTKLISLPLYAVSG